MKDWRGTEIEAGSRVIWHGESSYRVGIGTVTVMDAYERGAYTYGHLQVEWHEHKAHKNKKSMWLDINRVTVLTKDMLDD